MNIRYSLVLLCFLFAGIAQAQTIPNGSFEEWNNDGTPVSWTTSNNSETGSPIMKSTMHANGQFSVEGRVLDFMGMGIPPALLSAGSENGFPISGRPEALNGYIAGQFNGGDVVQVIVLVGNGAEDMFGAGSYMLATQTQGLTAFSAPIMYDKEGNASYAVISVSIISATQPSVGSVFFLDDLEFGPATHASVKQAGEPTDFTVTYSDRFNEIAFASSSPAFSSLEVLDVNGRIVESLYSGVTDQHRVRWAGNGHTNGMYFVRLTRPEGIEMKKVILNR